MTDKVRKQLGEPKNDLEKDTLNYIEPLVSEMIGEDIIGKGLTLKGSLEFCFKKGKKFEVRSGSSGCARITEEQHFAWVREYFGIKGTAPTALQADPQSADTKKANKPVLDIDLDDFLD